MSILTKRTFKARCKRLDDLMNDISWIYARVCKLHRHAPPYSAQDKGYDFWKNFEYKTTLEIIKAGSWVLYHLARMKIERYKKIDVQKTREDSHD